MSRYFFFPDLINEMGVCVLKSNTMKLIRSIMSVLLVIVLLFNFVAPVNASASAAAAISIGLSSGAAITCPAWLLPFILAVVALYGLEYFGYPEITDVNLLDAIVAKAGEFSQRASVTTQNWAKSVAAYIKSVTVIKYPEIFITEFNNHQDPDKKDWKFAAKFCVLLFGGSFLLDRAYKDGILKEESDLTPDQLAVANEQLIEINDQLNNIQNNIASTNGILSGIAGQLANFISSFTSAFEHLQLTVSTLRENLVYDFDAVQTQLHTLRINLIDKFDNLRTVEAASLEHIKNLNTTFVNKLTALNTTFDNKITALSTSLNTTFTNQLTALNTTFDSKLTALSTTLSTTFANNLTALITTFEDKIANLREVEAATLNQIKNLSPTFSTELGTIQTQLSTLRTNMLDKIADLREVEAGTLQHIKNLSTTFTNQLTAVQTQITTLRQETTAKIETLTTTITSIPTQINTKLDTLILKVEGLLTGGNPGSGSGSGSGSNSDQVNTVIGGMSGAADQLDNLSNSLGSIEKPTIGNVSANSLVPNTSLVALSAPLLALWENQLLLAILTIVVTVAMISWVFFGKKG